jgi:hypothetical protein
MNYEFYVSSANDPILNNGQQFRLRKDSKEVSKKRRT